eukprot:118406-Alexandrium_andersonii.AAC.1
MQGNGRPMQTAAAFVTKYAEYMVDGPPADVPIIDEDMVMRAFKANRQTAAGADAWSPEELSFLPRVAARSLAGFYRALERGAKWPDELLT